MAAVDVSIIIVNWNSKDYLKACIQSIKANTHKVSYEIIVVDSASFDGCDEMLQTHFPDVRFIQSESNVGFARANNMGTKLAKGDVLLFLNPDTQLKEDAIDKLYASFQTLMEPGVVGCRLLNGDGTLQTSCVQPFPTIINQTFDADLFLELFSKLKIWTSATSFENAASPVSIEAISGACMMMNRKAFDQVGQFSTDYFMYAEDLDLCYKVKAAGYCNYYARDIEVIHFGGGSTQHWRNTFSIITMKHSVYRFLQKYRGRGYAIGYRFGMVVTALVRLLMLTLLFPPMVFKQGVDRWKASAHKWFAILRWGLAISGRQNSRELSEVAKDNRCAESAEN